MASSAHKDVELPHVALLILSLTAAFVGAALGSLLPRPMGGVTLGAGVALVVGAFVPWRQDVMFMVGGPVLALVGGVLSAR